VGESGDKDESGVSGGFEVRLNVGSGQRRFAGYINIDCVSREGQVPDVIDDAKTLATFADGSADEIVLCHVLEHFVLPDAVKVIASCHRALRNGGVLKIVLPDMRALAQRWLAGMIDDYIFFVNAMGAYQGEDGDCHRWHFTEQSLRELLGANGLWRRITRVPKIDGLPTDWWMQSYIAEKL
jgi:SAM-dependent methyltransferase